MKWGRLRLVPRAIPWGLTLQAGVWFLLGAAALVQLWAPWELRFLAAGFVAVGLVQLYSALRIAHFDYQQSHPLDGAPPPFRWFGRTDWDRLLRAHEYLPAEPRPPGWGTALAHGNKMWRVHVGDEVLSLEAVRHGRHWVIRVVILRTDSETPVSDERCAEILSQLVGVNRFVEGSRMGDQPSARLWIGLPTAQKMAPLIPDELKGERPPKELRPVELTPALERARDEHLPRLLPDGWTVPVASTDPRGTSWTGGCWMMGVRDMIVLSTMLRDEGRPKLLVAIFRPDGEEVGDASAVEVLRHFRNVYEFSQGERSAEAPVVVYYGEVRKVERDAALLN